MLPSEWMQLIFHSIDDWRVLVHMYESPSWNLWRDELKESMTLSAQTEDGRHIFPLSNIHLRPCRWCGVFGNGWSEVFSGVCNACHRDAKQIVFKHRWRKRKVKESKRLLRGVKQFNNLALQTTHLQNVSYIKGSNIFWS